MKIGLKWIHMARYGVILRLDGALWLSIIFKPLLTSKKTGGSLKKRFGGSGSNRLICWTTM